MKKILFLLAVLIFIASNVSAMNKASPSSKDASCICATMTSQVLQTGKIINELQVSYPEAITMTSEEITVSSTNISIAEESNQLEATPSNILIGPIMVLKKPMISFSLINKTTSAQNQEANTTSGEQNATGGADNVIWPNNTNQSTLALTYPIEDGKVMLSTITTIAKKNNSRTGCQ